MMKNDPDLGVTTSHVKMEILDPKEFQLASTSHSEADESLNEDESNCIISQFDADSDLTLMPNLQSQKDDFQEVFSQVTDNIEDNSLNDGTVDVNDMLESEGLTITQNMDIRTRLYKLKIMLEKKFNISLQGYEFWLQNSKMLENHKTLVDQCIRGEGVVQVNLQIRPLSKRINIVDVLKPDEEYSDDVPPYDESSLDDEASVSDRLITIENTNPSGIFQKNKITKTLDSEHKKQSKTVKWAIDAQFAAEQMRLGIPEDPHNWTVNHVKYWIQWAVRQFNLTGVKLSDWCISGAELCSLTLDEFKEKCSSDPTDLFWTHLEVLRKCRFIAIVQNEESEKETENTNLIETECSIIKKKTQTTSQQLVMDSKIMPYYYTNRNGNSGPIQLWQFLLELLTSTKHTNVIRWIGDEGEFKFIDPETVAKLWGQRKHKPTMNYEKLSRALRYYYYGQMLSKVHNRRFVYKFVCNLKQLIGYDAGELARLVNGGNSYDDFNEENIFDLS